MKIRLDYVTNSSSSSFIIATNEKPPTGCELLLRRITSKNLPQIIEEMTYEGYDICPGMDIEEFKQIGGFTDEQIMIMQMAASYKLQTYLDILKALNNNTPVYYIDADRDYLYRCEELYDFVQNARENNELYDIER